MPELPEVEITTGKLQPLIGRIINSFWSNWPRGLRITKSSREINSDIVGRKILNIKRRGKAVIFELSGEQVLAFHQRMSGKLFIPAVKPSKDKHVHLKVFFVGDAQLWFRDPRKFGVVWYGDVRRVLEDKYFKNLGPDALSISKKEFIARLRVRRGMIKAMLLRQNFIAGVGNIVADETLWQAKIHPKRRVEDLSRLEKSILYRATQYVLRRSIKAQGTTLRDWGHPDGTSGGFQNQLNVYGRTGERCRRCGQKIMRIVVASRGTWVCAQCQLTG